MPNPTARDVGVVLAAARSTASTIDSISACSDRPSTSRCTRSCTSSCSSITPPSSLVPPRSIPTTLRLIRRGGGGHFVNIWGTSAGRDQPPPPESPPETGPSARFAMPSDKPEYRVYRSRPGFLNRLLRQAGRRALRAARAAAPPAESGRGAPAQAGPADRRRRTGPAGRASRPAPLLRPPFLPSYEPPGEPWYKRLTWKRVLVGRAAVHRVLDRAQLRAVHAQREHSRTTRSPTRPCPRSTTPATCSRAPTTCSCSAPTAAPARSAAAPTRSC